MTGMRRTKITREGAVLLTARGAGSDLVGSVEKRGNGWYAMAFDANGQAIPGSGYLSATRATAVTIMLGKRSQHLHQAAADAT